MRKTPIERILTPFQRFFHAEASGGLLLLLATAVALVWANSPVRESYDRFLHLQATLQIGPRFVLSLSLGHWINDGLMTVFFFVVGLEIKREFLMGELSTPKKAMLPIAGALGGVLVPAVIYAFFNSGGEGAGGWGIPMATDIAFATGVLALLGRRVPFSLKVFLTALAIADDLGAVLVIAVFYTSEIDGSMLLLGTVLMAILMMINMLGVRSILAYLALGLGLWYALLESGIHATIAGVTLAMTVPARNRINSDDFSAEIRHCLDQFALSARLGENALTSIPQQSAVLQMERSCERVLSPLLRLEHMLLPWVTFLIMPLFALANAGVPLGGNLRSVHSHPVAHGVIFGLVLGKPVGITLFSWLAIWSGLAEKPAGARWRQVLGVACLAGIGFTMSLFIANLAFGGSGELLLTAKMGILVASLAAGLAGTVLLWRK